MSESDRPKYIGSIPTDGLSPEQIQELERAWLAEARERAKNREKPSERLNRTGERPKDPIQEEVKLYRRYPVEVRRDMLLLGACASIAIESVRATKVLTPEGWRLLVLDEQFVDTIDSGIARVMASLPEQGLESTMKKIVADASQVMGNCGAHDSRFALLGLATYIMILMDSENPSAPPHDTVLCMASIVQEAQLDDPACKLVWAWDQTHVNEVMNRIRQMANLRGYLLRS